MSVKLTKGEKYDVSKLSSNYWVDGDGNVVENTDGYSVFDYFGHNGEYLGADDYGMEPTFHDDSVFPYQPTTTYIYHEESGHSEEIEAESMEEALGIAREIVEGGEWGENGASISVWVTKEVDGEEVDREWITVEIPPDHEALIREAVYEAGLQISAVCGTDPDCHDWTREGHGGCDENPGVWSTGGTGLSIVEHCSHCGLQRERQIVGSQCNPGEHDTVVYTVPEEWEADADDDSDDE